MAFSRDGNYLYSGARRDPDILCWDVRAASGVVYRLPRASAGTNQRIAFDIEPCGRHLVTGAHKRTLRRQPVEARERLRVAICMGLPRRHDITSEGQSYLGCARRTALSRMPSQPGWACVRACLAVAWPGSSVPPHLLLRTGAAGGEDGCMRAFDLATGEPKACFPAAGDTLNGAHFHPSLPLLATASGGAPRLPEEGSVWELELTCTFHSCLANSRPHAFGSLPPLVPHVEQRQACVRGLSRAGHRRYPLAPSDTDSDEGAEAGQPAPARQGAENALLVWRFQYTFTPFLEAATAALGTAEAVQGGGEAETSAPAGGTQLPAAAWGAHVSAARGGDATQAVSRAEGLAGAVQAAA